MASGDIVWIEEFDGPSMSTPPNWHPQNYRHSTSDMYFSPNPFCQSQDGQGHYKLAAFPGATPDGHAAWVPGGDSLGFLSPQCDTWASLAVQVGTGVEVSLRSDTTPGVWSSFWMLGRVPGGPNQGWPACGEIDVVEFFPQLGPKKCSQNLHGPSLANAWQDKSLNAATPEVEDFTQGFHRYGVEWRPTDITWLIDGVQTAKVTQAQYQAAGGDWTPFKGAAPMYCLLDIYIGGWVGEPDATSKFPAGMSVEYVKNVQL